MNIYGTPYFVNYQAAVRYYSAYHFPNVRQAVNEKIATGEIYIGRPSVKRGEQVVLIVGWLDGGTRYATHVLDLPQRGTR